MPVRHWYGGGQGLPWVEPGDPGSPLLQDGRRYPVDSGQRKRSAGVISAQSNALSAHRGGGGVSASMRSSIQSPRQTPHDTEGRGSRGERGRSLRIHVHATAQGIGVGGSLGRRGFRDTPRAAVCESRRPAELSGGGSRQNS